MNPRATVKSSIETITACVHLAFWIVLLTFSCIFGVSWSSSSLGAAHHNHHFHGSKHQSVPIAIYRSPASLQRGHGGSLLFTYLLILHLTAILM